MSSKGIDDLSLERATTVHVQAFVNLWIPLMLARRALDPNWIYRPFPWDLIIPHQGYTSFAAVGPGGQLEGLLAISSQPGSVKVEFVSAAPWNHGTQRRRRGVGAGLIGAAILQSKALGFGGALVLASTPESEPFYERLRFERTGQRDHEGLAIFRLPPERADAIISTYGVIVLRR